MTISPWASSSSDSVQPSDGPPLGVSSSLARAGSGDRRSLSEDRVRAVELSARHRRSPRPSVEQILGGSLRLTHARTRRLAFAAISLAPAYSGDVLRHPAAWPYRFVETPFRRSLGLDEPGERGGMSLMRVQVPGIPVLGRRHFHGAKALRPPYRRRRGRCRHRERRVHQ